MKKNVLVINGHPDRESFCTALANEYKKGADATATNCEILHLYDLKFNPILLYGYRKRMDKEPDIVRSQELISKADHIVFVYPNWWGTYPSLLKGFIDRTFETGYAYKVTPEYKALLNNKSAHLLVTTDTPDEMFENHYGKPGHNAMEKCVLNFCGIKPVEITTFGSIHGSDETKRKEWLEQVYNLGKELK